jgi:hypothetical protein
VDISHRRREELVRCDVLVVIHANGRQCLVAEINAGGRPAGEDE